MGLHRGESGDPIGPSSHRGWLRKAIFLIEKMENVWRNSTLRRRLRHLDAIRLSVSEGSCCFLPGWHGDLDSCGICYSTDLTEQK